MKLEVFDLRCDKYLHNSALFLVLREEEKGREILLPVSDYEFRCIKNLVFKKKSISYVYNLSKVFFPQKNELIIQDEEIKSKLTFSTIDNYTQVVILPPIEVLLYCADRKIEICVEEETFLEIQKLDFKTGQNFSKEKKIESNEEKIESSDLIQNRNEEKKILKNPTSAIEESKESFIHFPRNTNILDFNDIDNREEIVNIKVTEENIKSFSDENLFKILKSSLAEYHYENVILIQEELKNRNVDFWHELCKEDFL
ncbi:MAG: hypothetical protein LBD32_01935 [Cytophagales bacterium]|jgi:hypothetical protein|nr:hypothetical protein [Cytophagales bacterium]